MLVNEEWVGEKDIEDGWRHLSNWKSKRTL